MAERHPIIAWTSLLAIGFAAAGLWRAEVEWHGWDGLTWLGYFHWAVPISAASFIVWVVIFCSVRPWWKRAALIVAEILFAIVALLAAGGTMVSYFIVSRGNDDWAMLLFESGCTLQLGAWSAPIPAFLLLVAYPLVPLIGCAIARAFGACRTWKHWLVSNVIFLAAYPTAYTAMGLTRFGWNHDASIHTIKTGFIVPLLIVGLGVAFLPLGGRRCVSPEGAGKVRS